MKEFLVALIVSTAIFVSGVFLFEKANELKENINYDLIESKDYNYPAFLLAKVFHFTRKFIPYKLVDKNSLNFDELNIQSIQFKKSAPNTPKEDTKSKDTSKINTQKQKQNTNTINKEKIEEEERKKQQILKEEEEKQQLLKEQEEKREKEEQEKIRKEKEREAKERREREEQERISREQEKEEQLQREYDDKITDRIQKISDKFNLLSNTQFDNIDYSYPILFTINCPHKNNPSLTKFNQYLNDVSTPKTDNKWCVSKSNPICQVNVKKPIHITQILFPSIQDLPEMASIISIGSKNYTVGRGQSVETLIEQDTGSIFNIKLYGNANNDEICISDFQLIGKNQ